MVTFKPAVSYFTEQVVAPDVVDIATKTMATVLASDVAMLKPVHDAVVVPVPPAPFPSLAKAIYPAA